MIHAGFVHDFSKFAENCETDRRAIEALGAALKGSARPLLVTSGVAVVKRGPIATEDDDGVPFTTAYPRQSEATALKLAAPDGNGGRQRPGGTVAARSVRMAMATRRSCPCWIKLAREKGVSAYVGAGENRWPAVHRLDAASLSSPWQLLRRGAAGARSERHRRRRA